MVANKEIRSSSITYEQLMMRCFDRLDAVISTATREELFVLVTGQRHRQGVNK